MDTVVLKCFSRDKNNFLNNFVLKSIPISEFNDLCLNEELKKQLYDKKSVVIYDKEIIDLFKIIFHIEKEFIFKIEIKKKLYKKTYGLLFGTNFYVNHARKIIDY